MMCRPQERWGGNHPHDPSDFGRCHRLLEVMPSWRPLLAEKVSPLSCEWARLIEAWDELTALYLEELPSGNAPRTYHRMKEVIEGKAVSA